MLIEYSGKGPNLVLLHGWAMSRHCWYYLIPVFEKHFKTIRVDLPGHEEGCGSCFSFTREEELITELSNLCEESATWIGWSLGGLLAQRVAQTYPHKVNSLVCVGSGACYLQKDGWDHGVSEEDFNRFLKSFEADNAAAFEYFLNLQIVNTERASETLEILKLLLVNDYEAEELIAALELLRAQDMRKAIANYKCPILFVGGRADKLVSMENIRASSALAPQAVNFIIGKAGHAPMISHVEDFAGGLAEYMKTTDAHK